MTTAVIAIVVFALLLFIGIGIYNRLVRLRALVREAFSGINVQLRRRADLIPNLVETVKGYATHERDTLEAVIAQRGNAVAARGVEATAAADGIMTGLLGKLMAVVEQYPDLKADVNFQKLQDELTATENELEAARRYYNATARDLNTRVQSVPDNLVAGPFGFTTEPYYEDKDPAIQTAPQVDFAS
ncbi:LemA family protein [Sphingomicrobium astaxanthinifaciens]|uniref:LemA family protein n=1 Tax=Sphingomicrobium astaxanthinifaciens TaxID=1227949 RepID=UPI001FCC5DE2|nr:LemA family protein [Sphingomicrobium astaxanthinifaciens]MCJ7420210.1 LemA family protein [Sphingomicrobium astaxanthinifaciens]